MIEARPSPWLESLATFCLGAPADDCRLGDLSELHVRTEVEIRSRLDGMPGGATVARLAADARYIATTVNVMAVTINKTVNICQDTKLSDCVSEAN